MAIQLPQIHKCDVVQCPYNMDKKCCTPAITVGEKHPACDTFYQMPIASRSGLGNHLSSLSLQRM